MRVLRVSALSRPPLVAGALAAILREVGSAEIEAVGAGAVNQTVKAVAIARRYLADSGRDLTFVPEFFEVTAENGGVRTAIRFTVNAYLKEPSESAAARAVSVEQ